MITFKTLLLKFIANGTGPKRLQTRKAHTKKDANLKGLTKAMICK